MECDILKWNTAELIYLQALGRRVMEPSPAAALAAVCFPDADEPIQLFRPWWHRHFADRCPVHPEQSSFGLSGRSAHIPGLVPREFGLLGAVPEFAAEILVGREDVFWACFSPLPKPITVHENGSTPSNDFRR